MVLQFYIFLFFLFYFVLFNWFVVARKFSVYLWLKTRVTMTSKICDNSGKKTLSLYNNLFQLSLMICCVFKFNQVPQINCKRFYKILYYTYELYRFIMIYFHSCEKAARWKYIASIIKSLYFIVLKYMIITTEYMRYLKESV